MDLPTILEAKTVELGNSAVWLEDYNSMKFVATINEAPSRDEFTRFRVFL